MVGRSRRPAHPDLVSSLQGPGCQLGEELSLRGSVVRRGGCCSGRWRCRLRWWCGRYRRGCCRWFLLGLGVAWRAQALPFQCSARVRVLPVLVKDSPTARWGICDRLRLGRGFARGWEVLREGVRRGVRGAGAATVGCGWVPAVPCWMRMRRGSTSGGVCVARGVVRAGTSPLGLRWR